MKKYKQFETERLILRPTGQEDAAFLLELLNSPKWLKYIGDRKVYTEDQASDYIKIKIIPQLERLGYANYTVIRKTDNLKVGMCGLYDREGLEGIDLGFAFLPQHEKKGYAFESASMLKEAAKMFFRLESLNAITNPDNLDSQKLLIRLGFEQTGPVRIPNDPEELLLFKVQL